VRVVAADGRIRLAMLPGARNFTPATCNRRVRRSRSWLPFCAGWT